MTNLPRAAHRASLREERRAAVWFTAPATVLLFTFLVVPFLMAFYYSFTNQRLLPSPTLPTRFVGLLNYGRMLDDDTLRRALLNNLTFALVVVPVQSAFALGLALLVNQKLPGMRVFRTVYFMPVVTIMTVVAIVWFLLYDPGNGLINAFLRWVSFGAVQPHDWLGDKHTALFAVMLLSVWQGVGFQMLIFLAGLQNIARELYEAASIDGAGLWRQFVSVTLPQLRNTTIFVVVTATIFAFQLFDQVYVLPTRGGPEDSTTTVIVRMVIEGFSNQKVGYASAIAVVFFVLVLGLSLLQRRLAREERQV